MQEKCICSPCVFVFHRLPPRPLPNGSRILATTYIISTSGVQTLHISARANSWLIWLFYLWNFTCCTDNPVICYPLRLQAVLVLSVKTRLLKRLWDRLLKHVREHLNAEIRRHWYDLWQLKHAPPFNEGSRASHYGRQSSSNPPWS